MTLIVTNQTLGGFAKAGAIRKYGLLLASALQEPPEGEDYYDEEWQPTD